MATHSDLIALTDVSVTYGPRRLRTPTAPTVAGVTIGVAAGQTLGIVGESGSGKSTLARAIAGLTPVSGGTIAYSGAPLTSGKPHPDIQMVFQDPDGSLDPHLAVIDTVIEPLRYRSDVPSRSRRGIAEDLLVSVGLGQDLHTRRPRFLSGGQKQRVAIARALASEPKVLVADEPVSALDVSVQAQVLNLLLDLQEDRGLTLVLISHDLAVVNHMSDRIGVMSRGRLVEQGTADDVVHRPSTEYTRTLLSAVPAQDLLHLAVRTSPSDTTKEIR